MPAGVDRVFGLIGEDLAPLVVELDRLGVPYVAARHENQAVAMADGYSRLSGNLGVVVLTSGPGFTNGLTLITTASRAHSSVLVIVGARSAREDEPGNEAMRVGKYFPYLQTCALEGIRAIRPRDASSAVAETRVAIAEAQRGETIVLSLAVDVVDAPAVNDETAPLLVDEPRPADPDPAQIALVADLVHETWAVRRPVVLAGKGAVKSGAGPALEYLADLIGAATTTSLFATPLFAGDPYYLGVCGTFSHSLAGEVITSADWVLAFGASLNWFTTWANSLFPHARVIQVDSDARAFGRYVEVEPELRIQADARLAAEALVAELEARGHRSAGVRTDELRKRIAAFDLTADFHDESLPDKIDPRTAVFEIARMLPPERNVVLDSGHHLTFTGRLHASRPEQFAMASEAGSIGTGLGAGIGAAFAPPGRLTVVGVGDGGLMMSLGDLETAVRYELPMVIVICNDMGLGMEVHFLDLAGIPSDVAKHSTPDFAKVADALGAEGFTVTNRLDLEQVASRLQEPVTGPIVIDCHVNPKVRGAWVESLHGAGVGPRRRESKSAHRVIVIRRTGQRCKEKGDDVRDGIEASLSYSNQTGTRPRPPPRSPRPSPASSP